MSNEASLETAATKPGPIRRLYDWVLGWADTAYGPQALLGLAFVESIFFPVPPDVLLMALVLGRRERAWNFAMLCTIGSVVGGIIGYLIGAGLWESVGPWFYAWVPGFSHQKYETVRVWFETYSFWAVFAAGFTPIPYKVFTISSGVFGISMPIFIVASVASRGLRFFLIAGLLWKFGDPIKGFIDRYFNLLAFGGTALLIGGFVLLKYL